MKKTNLHFMSYENGNPGAFFSADVVKEYSSGHVEVLGTFSNSLELIRSADDHFIVEWIIEGYDVIHIGLDLIDDQIVDYDGVFELPEPIVSFLTTLGYDCTEVTA